MPTFTTKKIRTKNPRNFRNMVIKTDRGNIRLAIHTENAPSVQNKRAAESPPIEIELTLRSLLINNEASEETEQASWHDYPTTEGFFVRWEKGQGLSEIYYGGEDTPAEYVREGAGVQYFGPFQIPL
jgi:hypothetical protein